MCYLWRCWEGFLEFKGRAEGSALVIMKFQADRDCGMVMNLEMDFGIQCEKTWQWLFISSFLLYIATDSILLVQAIFITRMIVRSFLHQR